MSQRNRRVWDATLGPTLCLAALLALSGCGKSQSSTDAAELSAVEPWAASNVIGVVDETTTVDVRDDYYLATMQSWLSTVQVPSDLMSWGSMDERMRQIDDELLAICNDDTKEDHDVDLMRAYMAIDDDWDTRDQLGIEPIRAQAERIQAIETTEDLTRYLTSDEVRLWGNYLNVGQDDLQGESLIGLTPIIRSGQAPRVLVDTNTWITEEDWESDEEITIEEDAAYLLERLGISEREARRHVDNMLDFETIIDDAQYAEGRERDRLLKGLNSDLAKRIREADDEGTYTVDMTRAEVIQCAGDFPIADLLDAYGFGEVDSFQVYDPLYLLGLGTCYNEHDLELLRSHLLVGLVMDAQYYLDADAYLGAEDDDDGDEDSEGVDESRVAEVDAEAERTYYLIDDVIFDAPEIATNVYVRYCYAPQTNERVLEICDMVLDAWRSMIREEDWLSEDSKREAIAKIDEMDVYVGSEVSLMDTDSISLEGVKSPWEALYRIRQARTNYVAAMVLDPDSEALWASPIDVNAYYYNQDNAIFVGCGYLGGELFDLNAPLETQLAVVGHTVAHEVGHAFDAGGVAYDSKGNSRLWMSEQDQDAFDERVRRVQDYLDDIAPMGTETYDGELVSDELVADMAGLKAVMRIAQDIDGFDYKRFFEDYCIGWKSVATIDSLEDQLETDTHPFDATRANVTVMQVDEFQKTYGVQPGDGMYLAPEDRISVW